MVDLRAMTYLAGNGVTKYRSRAISALKRATSTSYFTPAGKEEAAQLLRHHRMQVPVCAVRASSVAVLIPFLAMGAAAGDDGAWRTAERNWTEFTQVRQAALHEARRFARFRHPLLDRRLPLYHFYSDGVQVYVLARSGEVYAHAQRAQTEVTPAWCRLPLCEVRDASDILRHAGVVVDNDQEAGDAIRLFVLITCNGFVPQGDDVLGAYKPVATKHGAAEWRVHLEYAGASEVSVLMQPSYRIITNGKHRLIELRRINDLTGPLGERL